MSTQISVSVALESLRKLSRAQINANRQRQLLDYQRRLAAFQAVKAQAQTEAAKGRDLRGGLLYGIRSDRQRPQPQPAVYRRSTGAGWILEPSDVAFNAKVGGINPFAFAVGSTLVPFIDGTDRYQMAYVPGAGPNGTPALYASSVPVLTDPGNGFYESYLRADTTYTAEPPDKAFTCECMFKIPTSTATFGSPTVLTQAFANFCGGYVRITAIQDSIDVDFTGVYRPVNKVEFEWGFPFTTSSARLSVLAQSYPGLAPHEIVVPGGVDSDVYHHAAIVQTPGSSDAVRSVSFYLNGVRRSYQPDVPKFFALWYANFKIASVLSQYRQAENIPTLLHGIRFTPRALYTGTSFTPPTSITYLS